MFTRSLPHRECVPCQVYHWHSRYFLSSFFFLGPFGCFSDGARCVRDARFAVGTRAAARPCVVLAPLVEPRQHLFVALYEVELVNVQCAAAAGLDTGKGLSH
jgi:hypothetical protein